MKRHLEIQTNHKHLTPEGLPSHHVYDENKKNVAAFVDHADALIFVTAATAKPKAKTNHQLRETLSQLKDWAEIELRIAEHPEARKAWRDVAEWADGVASTNKITLSKIPNLKS